MFNIDDVVVWFDVLDEIIFEFGDDYCFVDFYVGVKIYIYGENFFVDKYC